VKLIVNREVVISVFYQGEAFIPFIDGFKEGLHEFIAPAKNIHITYKMNDVIGDTQPIINATVKDLIDSDKPNVIIAIGPQIIASAKLATIDSKIPVLYGFGGNPNDGKFVNGMQSSGNNLTGVTWRAFELSGKRLEILKRIDPQVHSVLIYSKKGSAALKSSIDYIGKSAAIAKLKITIKEVNTTEEFSVDLEKFDKKEFDAVSYVNDPFFVKNNVIFQKTIAEKKIPAVFHDGYFARSGALASFGAEYRSSGKQLSRLAKKIIIDGQKPTDIPSEVATQLNLVLNEDTAKKFGIVFPEDLLLLANEIIPVTTTKTLLP